MSWAPYMHPSGEYIIFASNKLGFENFELFIVDAQGTKEPVRVTYSDGFDGLPVPSPDGKTLAWTSSRSGGSAGQLFLAQWNHEKALEAFEERAAEKAEQEIMIEARHDLPRKHAEHAEQSFSASLSAFVADPVVAIALVGGAQRAHRRRARTSKRSRRRGSKAASPGSNGERLASDYIVAELQKIGAKPLPGQRDYRLPFDFTAGTRDGGVADHRSRAAGVRDAGRRPRALVLRQRRRHGRRSCSPATASSCPRRRASATTATRRST